MTPNSNSETDWPVVSVVIAARNEAASIERAVRSALDQEYAGELEVIVADGRSEDDTRRIVEMLDDARVRVVDNPDRTAASGLNQAIRASRGTVVVRCDGHAVLTPGYIRVAVETLRATGAANVGGKQAATGNSFFGRAVALAMNSPLGAGDARFHVGGPPGPVDTVYLGVFDRDALEDVGLFDESLARNQDYELNYRLRKAGHTVWFTPELSVEYTPRAGLKALWRQYFDYGRWKRAMLADNPAAVRWRQLVPPLFVLGLAISIGLVVGGLTVPGLLVPGAYVVFLVAGSAYYLLGHKRPEAILLPVVLPAMHLAWGTGFLLGPPDHTELPKLRRRTRGPRK